MRGLHWRAISRGLDIDRVTESNNLSRFTRAALNKRAIDRQHTSVGRTALSWRDLARADLAIAMCEVEHRPMIAQLHPLWVDHIVYWKVRDLPYLEPDVALPQIECEVSSLIETLSSDEIRAVSPEDTTPTWDTIYDVEPIYEIATHS
jgi:protein-tyrosine phosphatase